MCAMFPTIVTQLLLYPPALNGSRSLAIICVMFLKTVTQLLHLPTCAKWQPFPCHHVRHVPQNRYTAAALHPPALNGSRSFAIMCAMFPKTITQLLHPPTCAKWQPLPRHHMRHVPHNRYTAAAPTHLR
jgi:hypothetical protein